MERPLETSCKAVFYHFVFVPIWLVFSAAADQGKQAYTPRPVDFL